MAKVVILDTGPLGMITHPRANPDIVEWLKRLLGTGATVLVPEIADYELRRELLRAQKDKSVQRLDDLEQKIGYIPITTAAMRTAAEFWAQARHRGQPTADDRTLDGDMILAAQGATYPPQPDPAIIATTNVGHLSRFAIAHPWQDIV